MNFYLPDFYTNFQLNNTLIQLINKYPYYFYDNIKIGGIYGTYPGAIWNGGRVSLFSTDANNIKLTTEFFNNQKIPLRFTFTNCLLKNEHLNDTYCNLIMDIANNGMNEIIINSELLESYLRKKYPNYKYILSTTRCERNVDKINFLCDKYDMIVIDYRDNINFDFLSKLEQKNKIEILINAYCSPNCIKREWHYQELSKCQLNFELPNENLYCPAIHRDFYSTLSFDSVIKNNDLYSIYSDMGFSNFKIEGRTVNPIDVINSYVYYLVKLEFQDMIRVELLQSIY